MKQNTNFLTTVKKTVQILKEFTKGHTELGITEISRRTGFSKSAVNRIIQTLYEEEVLYRNPQNHKYRLGLAFFVMGSVVYNELAIGQIAISILQKLKIQLKGNLYVVVYDRGEIIYLQIIPESMQLVKEIGARNPPHATAGGKLLLAHQSQKELDRVLDQKLLSYTKRTKTDRNELLQELEQIKKNGYAVAIGEFREGVSSIAVPIYNDFNKVVAALSLTRKDVLLTKTQIADIVSELKLCSRLITEKMIYNIYNNK